MVSRRVYPGGLDGGDKPRRSRDKPGASRHDSDQMGSGDVSQSEEAYARALRFWYGRINYEQRTAQPGDFGLDRMRTLLARLGNPERPLRIVHVAGSKGKGSTSAMRLAAAFA